MDFGIHNVNEWTKKGILHFELRMGQSPVKKIDIAQPALKICPFMHTAGREKLAGKYQRSSANSLTCLQQILSLSARGTRGQ